MTLESLQRLLIWLRRLWCGAAVAALPLTQAHAVVYTTEELEGKKAIVCRVDLRQERLELFLRDDAGKPLRSFQGVNAYLATKGRRLAFAMNAGMYHGNMDPVGLFASEGRQVAPLNLEPGEGNFFMKPNGVFLIAGGRARVVESSEMLRFTERIELATQSGPLLLRAGRIHPVFKPDSDSRLTRNGVGVREGHEAIFVISEDVMNLHEFARLFRDVLKCPDALYFDGTVSSLYAPPLQRSDKLIDLGPMIGITEPITRE